MKSLLDDPLLAQVPAVQGYRTLGLVALYGEIGRGGMGAVYRGRHLNLDIDVAVKCMLDTSGDAELIARFRREAMLVAKIRSPHLVQVMDVRDEYGLHYIVMEFVAGETVEGRIRRRGALPPAEAVAIALGAARGLAAAHQKSVIHRDVKPGNVLVSSEGDVKLLDLGIAKGKSESGDAMVTMTTAVMGTPLYMPPEQFESAANVTPAADVYALGATLAFMLLGQHAIRGRTLPEITREVTVRGFPDLQQCAPQVPAVVAALVKRATAMDPAARFADAQAFAAELQRVLTGLGSAPVLADPLAYQPRPGQGEAPSPTVMEEIRRSVTTRSQPKVEVDEPDDADAAATVRSVPRDVAAAVGKEERAVDRVGPGRADADAAAAGAAGSAGATASRAAPTTNGAATRVGTVRRSRLGVYAGLLVLGGVATAVAWQFARTPDEQASGKQQQAATDTGKDGQASVQPKGGEAATGPGDESTKQPAKADAPDAKPVSPEATGNDGKPASDPPGRTPDPAKPPETAPTGREVTPTNTEAPVPKPEPVVTKAADPSPTRTEPPSGQGDPPKSATPAPADGPAAQASPGTPATKEVGAPTDSPAKSPPEAPVPPAPAAAERFASSAAAARSNVQAADWNAALKALDDARAAATVEALRTAWRPLADEVLTCFRAGLAENLATPASERAARVAAWDDTLPRLAESGSGMAALLLVESRVCYDEAKDKIASADPRTTLGWARLAAGGGIARGAFFAGELLRQTEAAAVAAAEGKEQWQLVHECYLQGVALGDGDCAARIAGIYHNHRAFKRPLLWRPPGVDNLDAWAAGLARTARAAGTARGHFTMSQFLLFAVEDQEFSRSSGISEEGEQTTYPKELEQAARLRYVPAIDELRRKQQLRWASDALQRLRRDGVIDR